MNKVKHALGFDEPRLWGEPATFAMPSRQGHIDMLNQAKQEYVHPNGDFDCWDAYFWCDEVDVFWRTIADRVVAAHGPTDRPEYGMREIAIKDPDGYTLVFAADIDT